MKALTLWQPWASLMAVEAKKLETRCWKTKYRGKLAIHSAANIPGMFLGKSRLTDEFSEQQDIVLGRHNGLSIIKSLPRGVVLCIVDLIDVVPVEQVRDDISRQEKLFGNYEDGRYAWVTTMIEKFETPIPAKGNRLLWEWNYATE